VPSVEKTKPFDVLLVAITLVLVVLCAVPLLNVAAVSISSNAAILARKVLVWPVGFSVTAYQAVLGDMTMLRALAFTVVLTAFFSLLSMTVTVLAAYPLTKRKLKGRNAILVLIVITLYFQGGIIPDYVLVKNLGLLDTPWSLILPQLVSAFYLIILKTFFSTLPESLEESAFLDGASHTTILTRIVLPLSTPALATLSLFYAVWRWNGFQDSLLYITNQQLFPLQLKLYQIVFNAMALEVSQMEGAAAANLLPESIRAASVMFATIPILLVYPWLQRYFISGIMIGAIKG
jgi:putative aldouronate transport system permease protein